MSQNKVPFIIIDIKILSHLKATGNTTINNIISKMYVTLYYGMGGVLNFVDALSII